MEIGERIKQRRLQLGLSQEELAKKLGYSHRSTIACIESGRNQLRQSKIAKIAAALDTTPGHLMGWLDEPEDSAEQDVELVMKYHALSQENQRAVMAMIDALLK